MDKVNKEIEKALQLQKEIFGDLLFEKTPLPKRKTTVVTSNPTQNFTVKEPAARQNSEITSAPVSSYSPIADAMTEEFQSAANLEDLNTLICNCLKCPLGKGRTNFVFGTGNPNADVMILGEGPGEQEDQQGLPFVGRSGQLLTDILKAINFSREEIYIANIVKCRPPGNRAPFASEMDQCIPYLRKQIELIKPKAILCVGRTAAQGLLKRKESLDAMRGHMFKFDGIKVMVTYHPAALLRNPSWKRGCWEDVQAFRRMYDSIK